MNVQTQPCVVCGNTSWVTGVDALGFIRWSEMGEYIQDALPELDTDQRELLISGTHAHCWHKMFGESDD
jgi:hypothetical protein